LFRLEKPL
jgi:hypothetical protein